MALDLLAVAAVIFALNLLPAFGPPTAAVLVSLTLTFDLPSAALIVCGALAAAAGRYTLATMARQVRPRLSSERRRHLAAVEAYLSENRGRAFIGLGLFALSPVPSGQLFTAAGLMEVRLLPLTAAFFAGRLVSYTIYVTGANVAKNTVGHSLLEAVTSPIGIAVQLLALLALALLLRVDWGDVIARHRSRSGR